jgi:two-component system KDP operon response regulator KdpE
MEGKRILVVEDDVFIREMVQLAIEREGAEVSTAENGAIGLRRFYDFRPDLVIMDIMMPEKDGWELIRQIRQLSDTPVIMLSAISNENAIVRGLDMGATDYMTKPFSIKVLIARARAAMRLSTYKADPQAKEPVQYEDGHLTIDVEYRRVTVDGQAMRLTDTEFRLLALLLENKGRVLTFKQILDEIWGSGYRDSIEYVHVYISRLRKKLEVNAKDPHYIVNEHQVGYRFIG